MNLWLILGIVIIGVLGVLLLTNLVSPNVLSSILPTSEEVILESKVGEVIFIGPNAKFKTDWNRVTETETHYIFCDALVSSNGRNTWELFPDVVNLNKIEWKIKDDG